MRSPSKLPRMMNVPSINLHPAQSFPRFDPGVGRVFADFGGTPTPEDRSFQVNMPAAPEELAGNQSIDWDPRAVLSNLAFLEQKIHQVQGIVRSIVDHGGQFPVQPDELAAQQQAVNADLTSIVIQLISTAGSLLPSVKNSLLSAAPASQLSSIIGGNGELQQTEAAAEVEAAKSMDYEELLKGFSNCTGDVLGTESMQVEDHEVKESEDGMDGEHLPPGSYEILQLEKEEILAPHTHFCSICGKGFKRDANLRMHMRGHGDEYKTAAALAKPAKEASSEPVIIRRYSCPFAGCKRNKEHKKFQPLKTILCVKNHYKRSHCDKSYICSRCNCKKFSVLADLKTHEKHCGRDKWLCSCGTTFSRKDKLFGHVALFQGHTPALPLDELKAFVAADQSQASEAMSGVGNVGYGNYAGNTVENVNDLDIKGLEDDRAYYSSMNFDSCNFGGLDEFPRPVFDFPESSFSFVPVASGDFVRKNGSGSSSGRLG